MTSVTDRLDELADGLTAMAAGRDNTSPAGSYGVWVQHGQVSLRKAGETAMQAVVRSSTIVAGTIALGLSFAAAAAVGATPAALAAASYGPQVTLPFAGLAGPFGVAVDSAGNVYAVDPGNERVVELPAGATSSSQQITLPFTGLSDPFGVAVDSAGDVYVSDEANGDVVELPAGATSSSQQITLPFAGLSLPTGWRWTAPGTCTSPSWAAAR
jgi:serine/threonine protein kinase, bacterial